MRNIKDELDDAAGGCLLLVGLLLIGATAWRICLHYDLSFWWGLLIAAGMIVLLFVFPSGYATGGALVAILQIVNMFLSGVLTWFICQKLALSTGWSIAIVLVVAFVVAPIVQLFLVQAAMEAKLNQIKKRVDEEER
jgi:multisubunit Na+/H+ antiporter MnhG subunit